ncbi:MAG: RRXRR domain-containing protein, partial [Promethearchaeota archaeon]
RREEGGVATSIKHKLDSHLRFIELLKSIRPITRVTIEVGSFDIQKIKNPAIEGIEYQEGEQKDFWNLREYILHRNNHRCQNSTCKNKKKQQILEVHHIGFWKGDRSHKPSNLIILCIKCHIPKNHQENGVLHGWSPKLKSFNPETFMAIIRWRLVNALKCDHTYGYLTKMKRKKLDLKKSHTNDAFVIANGMTQQRVIPTNFEQIRRNNRSFQKCYDAKYLDTRTGKKASG